MHWEPPAVEALRDALKAPNEYTRHNAAEALGDLGKKAEPVAPALVETLTDESGSVRANTIEALGTTSQSSAIAVPGLVKALKDSARWCPVECCLRAGTDWSECD